MNQRISSIAISCQCMQQIGGVGLLLVATVANGQALATEAVDKSQYTIFNPTPPHLLRPLSADRPDFTESPITVDAGHVQLELSFSDYTFNSGSSRVHSLSVLPVNLKLGLTHNMDIQFIFDPYILEKTEDGPRHDANGDLQIRWKINIWGNDGGPNAFGIMPFIKIPIASDGLGNNHVDGGLIFAIAMDMPEDWGLGLMLEFDFPYDETDGGYDVEFIHTAVIGHDIVGKLAGYIEYIGIVSTDPDTDYQPLIGIGVTLSLNENTVLDAGVNVGLTHEAEDVNVFIGMTKRF